jgi:hypothetical protein
MGVGRPLCTSHPGELCGARGLDAARRRACRGTLGSSARALARGGCARRGFCRIRRTLYFTIGLACLRLSVFVDLLHASRCGPAVYCLFLLALLCGAG